MSWSVDARIPLAILESEVALTAALAVAPGTVALRDFDAASAHAPACTCCVGRTPVAVALDELFQARVRGTLPWFKRVVALAQTEEARAALITALREDVLTAARFRAA